MLLDASGDVTGTLYGVWVPPTAYFIDRKGQLIGRVVGARDWSMPAAREPAPAGHAIVVSSDRRP